jgi:hypothetical protein
LFLSFVLLLSSSSIAMSLVSFEMSNGFSGFFQMSPKSVVDATSGNLHYPTEGALSHPTACNGYISLKKGTWLVNVDCNVFSML